MRHLAAENARFGVTANSLALGLMQPDNSAALAGLERQIPVGRTGTPDDVGAACVYLASDEASWMTGQTLHLDGGSTFS
jgi:NAD(P)-dependent dehydrogenase (short-subunit alcohol dehydrogenase family)